uniref:Nuclear receptor domain-containing protein n=1 Tax=Rhabditophanes sp. KR3021 TaxID=114890 RepID=A0AC35TL49_9BILA
MTDASALTLIEKRCMICEERTTETHYNINCCNKCRVFFRRYVNKIDRSICLYNKNCDLTQFKKCQWCRAQRCYSSGMTDAAVKHYKQIKDDVQTKKRAEKAVIFGVGNISGRVLFKGANNSKIAIISNIPHHETFNQAISNLFYTEKKFHKFRDSTYRKISLLNVSLDELFERPCELGMLDRFNFEIKEEHTNTFTKDNIHAQHLFDSAFLALDFVKMFDMFNELNLEDKKELLHYVSPAVISIDNLYYSWRKEYSCVHFPDGHSPLAAMKAPSSLDVLLLVTTVDITKRLKPTLEEHCFIKMLTYCNANCSQALSDKAKIFLIREKEKYSHALLQHLQFLHGQVPGAVRFNEIIQFIGTMFDIGDKLRMYYKYIVAMSSKQIKEEGKIVHPLICKVI